MEDIIQYASDVQTFLGLRHLSSDVIADESFLRSLLENGKLDKFEIAFEVDENITSFCNSINKFGSIKLRNIASSLRLENQIGKQAQTMEKRNYIENIAVKFINTLQVNTTGYSITGCDFLPDGNMVFCNYSLRANEDFIAVFTSNGRHLDKISLKPNWIFDVVSLDEKIVAVTSPTWGELSIMSINLHSKEVTKTRTECPCYSSTFFGGKLLPISPKRGILTIDAKNGKIMSTIQSNLTNNASLTSFESKLYICDPNNNISSCCDMEGNTIWSFKDDSVIKNPSGIAVDGIGNVYVTNQELNNVIVISPDGNQSKQLLCQSNGLNNPTAIQYDRRQNRLLVANKLEKAFLFDISL